MIEMMEPSKALVAIHTLLSFIPIGHNVPDQAVLRIGLNLPQTLLTAITGAPASASIDPGEELSHRQKPMQRLSLLPRPPLLW